RLACPPCAISSAVSPACPLVHRDARAVAPAGRGIADAADRAAAARAYPVAARRAVAGRRAAAVCRVAPHLAASAGRGVPAARTVACHLAAVAARLADWALRVVPVDCAAGPDLAASDLAERVVPVGPGVLSAADCPAAAGSACRAAACLACCWAHLV